MPTVRVSEVSMALLIAEARERGVKVQNVLDALILETLGEEEEETEEEAEEEEETAEEEEEEETEE